MIEYRDVSLYYDKIPVLQDVNLTFKHGVVTGLLGPNGCGKSTLLSSLLGTVRYTGSITLAGREIREYAQAELARVLAAVPQAQDTCFPYRVIDVVLLGRMPHVRHLPRASDLEKALDCLSMVKAAHLADRIYTRISGGERQLVAIARALCQEPRIIAFDEPTSYLDFRNTYAVLSLIRELTRGKGLTSIVSVHDPNLALQYCDELVLFRNPRLIQGRPEDLITQENILAVYDLKAEVMIRNGARVILPYG